jgi:hypothetical protein
MKKSLFSIVKTLAIILTAVGVIAGGYALYVWHLEISAGRIATDKDIAAGLVNAHGKEQLELPSPVRAKPIALSQTLRLAVGGLGLSDENENRQLGDLVTVGLTDTPGFALVERRALSAVLQELNLNWAGFVRAKDAVRAGKLLKVDWFLLGTEAKINDTNSIVTRVVDARTGVMMDAGVFPAEKPLTEVASDLAAFLRASRQSAAQPKPRVFLAVGAFEDLSINNRQVDFPKQLQGYLTAAYRGSGVTLLEREYVETLLQEVHLDMAGLTEESWSNAPPVMQSAFWLVDGQYQSYETTNIQIELNLEIQRAFGKKWQRQLRGLPGDRIGEQTKAVVDALMQQNATPEAPTRRTEARMQFAMGQELCEHWLGVWQRDPELRARRTRHLQEAIRAFETAVLLEPTNHSSSMLMAKCLRDPDIGRFDEACNCYQQFIDASAEDSSPTLAQWELLQTLLWYTPEQRIRWLQSASRQTTNPVAVKFYQQQAGVIEEETAISAGDSPQTEALAEHKLFEVIQSACDWYHHKRGASYRQGLGMADYMAVFGNEQTQGAAKLAGLLPKMTRQFPEMEAELVVDVLSCQPSGDTPVIADFQRALTNLVLNANQDITSGIVWLDIHQSYYWCQNHTNWPLAIQVLENVRAAAKQHNFVPFGEQENITLAYAYLEVARWQDALDIFQSFNHRPVKAGNSGPWGDAFCVILPDQKADYCRRKLGLPVTPDARQFDLGNSVLCLCAPSSFLVADEGLWVGIAGQLMHLDFELRTNFSVQLPVAESVPINALRSTPGSIWIATRGAGLIEYDKASRHCRLITEAEGLMLNDVATMEVEGDTLWIGYKGATGGGLGELNLASGKIVSFMHSLNGGVASSRGERTPNRAVDKIVAAADGTLLLSVARSLMQFHIADGEWNTLTNPIGNSVTSLCADSEYLVEGGQLSHLAQQFTRETNGMHLHLTSNLPPTSVLAIEDLPSQQWHRLEDADLMPNPPSTLTIDGDNLWVGGEGTIALVDLKAKRVKKFCHIKAEQVDCIQIGGGYLWAQFDWHLFRAPLSALE